MVQFNHHTNEILLKIVYYGPALSGKTANLHVLHALCQDDFQGEFFSINTQEDRTLFFDLLPINLGTIFGSSIHIQLYTVPGQPQYDATRRVVLDGTDGVVFVADSSESKIQENIDSLTNMHHNLNANMIDIKQIPFVIQYNKRDLPDAMPVGLMNRKLNFRSVPYFETVAITGHGILETFVAIAKETISATFKKHQMDKKMPDFESFVETVEDTLRSSMSKKPQPMVELIKDKNTIIRHENTSVEDLPKNRLLDPEDLLTDALNSNMETARLYGDLKAAKEGLDLQCAELTELVGQLDKENRKNQKVRKYLERLLQSIEVPVISFDLEGMALTCNAAAESALGRAHREVLTRNISLFVPPDKQAEIMKATQEILKGAPSKEISCVYTGPGGKTANLGMAIAPIKDENSLVIAFSMVLKI
jgi:PAS domain S-box-containing protein